uniref:Uncharacterized protein n=1 Tax=Arundo donax TaxID=35708 RepID=A0A0A9HKW9_ARUDO
MAEDPHRRPPPPPGPR